MIASTSEGAVHMSLELIAILKKESLPIRQVWQRKIEELAFPLTLDAEFNPLEDSGYVPMDLAGTESGCEYYLDDLKELELPESDLTRHMDSVVSFRLGSRMDELKCALYCMLALIDLTDCAYYEESSGEYMKADSAREF